MKDIPEFIKRKIEIADKIFDSPDFEAIDKRNPNSIETEVEKDIRSFSFSESKNWVGGNPSLEKTISRAFLVNDIGIELGFKSEAHLCDDGSISITFYIDDCDHFFDVIINNHNHYYLFRYGIGKGPDYTRVERIPNISLESIYDNLKKYINELK